MTDENVVDMEFGDAIVEPWDALDVVVTLDVPSAPPSKEMSGLARWDREWEDLTELLSDGPVISGITAFRSSVPHSPKPRSGPDPRSNEENRLSVAVGLGVSDDGERDMEGADDSLLSFRLRMLVVSPGKFSSKRGGAAVLARRLCFDRFMPRGSGEI